MQTALRSLVQNLMHQKLARTVAPEGFVIASLGQEVAATEVEAKMRGNGLTIQLKKIEREIALLRGSLRNRVIKLAGARITFDRCSLGALPAGGFQMVEALQRRGVGGVVVLESKHALLFKLAAGSSQIVDKFGGSGCMSVRLDFSV